MPPRTPERLLIEGGETLGFNLKEQEIQQVLTYMDALRRWNRAMNLTSLTTRSSIIERHFLDSLMGIHVIHPFPGMKLADLGTGAGFPGIPIKINRPEIDLTLVESSGKKTAFLHHVCGLLNLKGVTVLSTRIEDLHRVREHLGRYDVIVSRAAARPPMTLKMSAPLLASGGRLVLYLTTVSADTLGQPEGWKATRLDYRLPFTGAKRTLLALSRLK